MTIRFGPAGLGPTKTALTVLESYHKKGFRACEIAFTYSVYIKEVDAPAIARKARELDIELSIHAPYFVNLNSAEEEKRRASKERILNCCRAGYALGAKVVVFHPGYYSDDKEKTYQTIKEGIIDMQKEIQKNKWDIKIAPETMGKVNVFGSVEEIARLVKETNCAVCIDFAHVLARDKTVDYKKIEKLFPQEEWHVHFSGIIYGDKGEKEHRTTEKEEWQTLLKNLPTHKKIRIINESPTMIEDTELGLKLSKIIK